MGSKGQADAFALDEVMLCDLAASRPGPKAVKGEGRFFTIEPLAILYPNGEEAFRKLINDEPRRLIDSPDVQTIDEKWFGVPVRPRVPCSMATDPPVSRFREVPDCQHALSDRSASTLLGLGRRCRRGGFCDNGV
ncbi:transporter substrate-binding domain-containing protein [Hydrogenophaga sp.]|uniref:transporter substrate-binding domain-containing protein n=1 Tax=Hydrogenophaga sp. TaxID=1904254 RepID=UPI002603761D|nr:transporter substrate-binding domain-containing protein [Hydrogenophaga sp.]MDM7950804.1 transporter substrate-binding domain-containing protein [Hydrogenophaga sp.]